MPTVESVAKEVHWLWAENRTRLNVSIALEARIRTQELEMVTCRRAFDTAAGERNALAVRVTELERLALFFDERLERHYAMIEALTPARPARERDDADDGRVINFDPDARSNFDNPSTLLHVKDGRVDVTEAHA